MVQEHVGQPELDEDYQPVGGLHCNKPEEVDVVPDWDWDIKHILMKYKVLLVVDILPEEIHQNILLLLLILHEAGGGPLAEELHEAALHDEPAHAGQVEEECEDDEVERHPLVVGVVHDGDAVLLPLLQRDAPELHAGGAGALEVVVQKGPSEGM